MFAGAFNIPLWMADEYLVLLIVCNKNAEDQRTIHWCNLRTLYSVDVLHESMQRFSLRKLNSRCLCRYTPIWLKAYLTNESIKHSLLQKEWIFLIEAILLSLHTFKRLLKKSTNHLVQLSSGLWWKTILLHFKLFFNLGRFLWHHKSFRKRKTKRLVS